MQMRPRRFLPLHSSTLIEMQSLRGVIAAFIPLQSSFDRVLMRPDLRLWSLRGCGGTIKGLKKANVGRSSVKNERSSRANAVSR